MRELHEHDTSKALHLERVAELEAKGWQVKTETAYMGDPFGYIGGQVAPEWCIRATREDSK